MTDWYWRQGHPVGGTDWWPEVRDHMPEVQHEVQRLLRLTPDLLVLCEQRFRSGEKEYQGEWLTKPLNWFDRMMAEEAADMYDYACMRRVRAAQIRFPS